MSQPKPGTLPTNSQNVDTTTRSTFNPPSHSSPQNYHTTQQHAASTPQTPMSAQQKPQVATPITKLSSSISKTPLSSTTLKAMTPSSKIQIPSIPTTKSILKKTGTAKSTIQSSIANPSNLGLVTPTNSSQLPSTASQALSYTNIAPSNGLHANGLAAKPESNFKSPQHNSISPAHPPTLTPNTSQLLKQSIHTNTSLDSQRSTKTGAQVAIQNSSFSSTPSIQQTVIISNGSIFDHSPSEDLFGSNGMETRQEISKSSAPHSKPPQQPQSRDLFQRSSKSTSKSLFEDHNNNNGLDDNFGWGDDTEFDLPNAEPFSASDASAMNNNLREINGNKHLGIHKELSKALIASQAQKVEIKPNPEHSFFSEPTTAIVTMEDDFENSWDNDLQFDSPAIKKSHKAIQTQQTFAQVSKPPIAASEAPIIQTISDLCWDDDDNGFEPINMSTKAHQDQKEEQDQPKFTSTPALTDSFSNSNIRLEQHSDNIPLSSSPYLESSDSNTDDSFFENPSIEARHKDDIFSHSSSIESKHIKSTNLQEVEPVKRQDMEFGEDWGSDEFDASFSFPTASVPNSAMIHSENRIDKNSSTIPGIGGSKEVEELDAEFNNGWDDLDLPALPLDTTTTILTKDQDSKLKTKDTTSAATEITGLVDLESERSFEEDWDFNEPFGDSSNTHQQESKNQEVEQLKELKQTVMPAVKDAFAELEDFPTLSDESATLITKTETFQETPTSYDTKDELDLDWGEDTEAPEEKPVARPALSLPEPSHVESQPQEIPKQTSATISTVKESPDTPLPKPAKAKLQATFLPTPKASNITHHPTSITTESIPTTPLAPTSKSIHVPSKTSTVTFSIPASLPQLPNAPSISTHSIDHDLHNPTAPPPPVIRGARPQRHELHKPKLRSTSTSSAHHPEVKTGGNIAMNLEDMQKSRPLVSFCFGGKLLVSMPRFFSGSSPQPGPIHLIPIPTLLSQSPDFIGMKSFPGPALSKSSKELSSFISTKIKLDENNLNVNNSNSFNNIMRSSMKSEASKWIWRLLSLLLESKGVLQGPSGCERTFMKQFIKDLPLPELQQMKDQQQPQESPPDPNPSSPATQLSPSAKPSKHNIVDQIQKLVCQGLMEAALDLAVKNQLWDHAITLSASLNPSVLRDIISLFTIQTLPVGSPLRCAYLQSAGKPHDLFKTFNQPKLFSSINDNISVSTSGVILSPSSFSSSTFDLVGDSWKWNLATMIQQRGPPNQPQLSQNPKQQHSKQNSMNLSLSFNSNSSSFCDQALVTFGDQLWTYSSSSEAAHLCYLFADHKLDSLMEPRARMVLLGGDHRKNPRTVIFDFECLHLTELLEFIRKQHYQSSSSPPMAAILSPSVQAVKLVHVCSLLDFGLVKQALDYLESLKLLLSDSNYSKLLPKHFIYQHTELYNRAKSISISTSNSIFKFGRSSSTTSSNSSSSGSWFGNILKSAVDTIIGEDEPPQAGTSAPPSSLPPGSSQRPPPTILGTTKSNVPMMTSSVPLNPPAGAGVPQNGILPPANSVSLTSSGGVPKSLQNLPPPSNGKLPLAIPKTISSGAVKIPLPKISARNPKFTKQPLQAGTHTHTNTNTNIQHSDQSTSPREAEVTSSKPLAPDSIGSSSSAAATDKLDPTNSSESANFKSSQQQLDEKELFDDDWGDDFEASKSVEAKQASTITIPAPDPDPASKSSHEDTQKNIVTRDVKLVQEKTDEEELFNGSWDDLEFAPPSESSHQQDKGMLESKDQHDSPSKSAAASEKEPKLQTIPNPPAASSLPISNPPDIQHATPITEEKKISPPTSTPNTVTSLLPPKKNPKTPTKPTPSTTAESSKTAADQPSSIPSLLNSDNTSTTGTTNASSALEKSSLPLQPSQTPHRKTVSLLAPKKTPQQQNKQKTASAAHDSSKSEQERELHKTNGLYHPLHDSSTSSTPVNTLIHSTSTSTLKAPEGLPELNSIKPKVENKKSLVAPPPSSSSIPPPSRSSTQKKRQDRMNKSTSASVLPRQGAPFMPAHSNSSRANGGVSGSGLEDDYDEGANSDDEKAQNRVIEDARAELEANGIIDDFGNQNSENPDDFDQPKSKSNLKPIDFGQNNPMKSQNGEKPSINSTTISSSNFASSDEDRAMKTPKKDSNRSKLTESKTEPKKSRFGWLNPKNWFTRSPGNPGEPKPKEVKLGGSLKDGPWYHHPELGWVERGKEEDYRERNTFVPPPKSEKKNSSKPQQDSTNPGKSLDSSQGVGSQHEAPETPMNNRGAFSRLKKEDPSTPYNPTSSSGSSQTPSQPIGLPSSSKGRHRKYVSSTGAVIDQNLNLSSSSSSTLLPSLPNGGSLSSSASLATVFTPAQVESTPDAVGDNTEGGDSSSLNASSASLERVQTVKQPRKTKPNPEKRENHINEKKSGAKEGDEKMEEEVDVINSQPLTLSASFPIMNDTEETNVNDLSSQQQTPSRAERKRFLQQQPSTTPGSNHTHHNTHDESSTSTSEKSSVVVPPPNALKPNTAPLPSFGLSGAKKVAVVKPSRPKSAATRFQPSPQSK